LPHDRNPSQTENYHNDDPESSEEVYKIPRFPPISVGDVVTVSFNGKDGEKPQHTVMICDDPKNTEAPEGVQAITARSTLAMALLRHDPQDGNQVSFDVTGSSSGKPVHNQVEIISVKSAASG
jgi:hypothetical protein